MKYIFREAKRAINNFLCLGSQTVIITLGKDGAIFASAKEPRPIHVRAPKVEEVLDTTVRMAMPQPGSLAHVQQCD